MKKRMKRGESTVFTAAGKMTISTGTAVLLLFLLLCINPPTAHATAPSAVKLAYDAATQALQVTVTHSTWLPSFHYVKRIDIKKNGDVISANVYDSQPDKLTFSYTYTIPAKEGDILEVTASCSLWGSRTEKLSVGNK